jgi:CRP-like cAMP-binding protein
MRADFVMVIEDKVSVIRDYVQQFEMDDFLNESLLSRLEIMTFPAYTNVYWEEEEQHYFYFLVKGQVQCYHYHLNGKLAVFAVSDPFMAIGDIEILNKEPVKSNVIATQDTIMLALRTEDVHHYGVNDPIFLRFLIDELRKKLYKTNALQVTQLLPVTSRLATYLLAQSADQSGDIFLPDKEGLASLLGTSFRHLNRVIKGFVDEGSIDVNYPQVTIINRQALEAWLDV